MKLGRVALVVFLACVVCFQTNARAQSAVNPGEVETKEFRRMRDAGFRDRSRSPLLSKDFENFKGLNYYAFDSAFRLNAEFSPSTERKTFLLPTSQNGVRKYLKIGVLTFQLAKMKQTLSAFAIERTPGNPGTNDELTDIFVPFRDQTNGRETYSSGRYLYLKMPKAGERAVLDFNLSYNPSCAYGDENYACTIPPKENFLSVEIRAGEKNFRH